MHQPLSHWASIIHARKPNIHTKLPGGAEQLPSLRGNHRLNLAWHSRRRSTSDQSTLPLTATAGSDVVQSGRPIFDDFFQHLWPYIGNNTANVVFQMVERLWLIRIDQ
ncbi:hypothetical protein TNCV_2312361 [Trichonephila clavipes]|nr:hypothetical protein TNCV_2312361 [Trichonephila clavipes]